LKKLKADLLDRHRGYTFIIRTW